MQNHDDVTYDNHTLTRLRSYKVPRHDILAEFQRRMDTILLVVFTYYRIQQGRAEPTAECSPENVKKLITPLCQAYCLPVNVGQGILKALMTVFMQDVCNYVGHAMSDEYIHHLIDADLMEFPGMMRVLWVAATAD
jgi:hypothetical protein